MKRNIIILAAALVAFAACNKEQGLEQSASKNFEIYATVEQQADDNATKSSLSGTTVSWIKNDSIKVFDASGKSTQMKAGSSGVSVIFTENETKREDDFSLTGDHYAIYPYSDGATCTGSTISFTLPATQTYAANSFGQDANVAVASFSGTDVASFKNVCGVLTLKLNGTITVSQIELSGNNSENLWGTFTINAANVTTAGATYSTGGGTTLTLDCGDGVKLDQTTATAFNIVVPVNAFGNGFTATVYEKGTSATYVMSTSTANIIKRSTIKVMPEKVVYAIPSDYQVVEYLESTGTQFINTGINPNGLHSKAELFVDVKYVESAINTHHFDCCGALGTQGGSGITDGPWFKTDLKSSTLLSMQAGTGNTETKITADVYQRHQLKWNTSTKKCYLDETEYSLNVTNTIFSLTYQFTLFKVNVSNLGACCAKIYGAYIKGDANNDGEIEMLCNFIPCYCKSGCTYKDGNTNSDVTPSANKPGMYDLVSGKFFVNQDTVAVSKDTDFTKGSDVTH